MIQIDTGADFRDDDDDDDDDDGVDADDVCLFACLFVGLFLVLFLFLFAFCRDTACNLYRQSRVKQLNVTNQPLSLVITSLQFIELVLIRFERLFVLRHMQEMLQ